MNHKPWCATNIQCAVYHNNGICSEKKPCSCNGYEALTPSKEKEIDKEELKKTVRSEFNSFAGIRNLKQGNWNMASVDEWLDTVIDRAADRAALVKAVEGLRRGGAKLVSPVTQRDVDKRDNYFFNRALDDVLALLLSPEKN